MRPALLEGGPGHVPIGGLIALFRTLKTVVLALGVGAALAMAGIQPAHAAPAAAAQITLSPAQGPAGTAVTVSGTGLKASTTGTVTAGSTTFSFQTTASGAFSTGITIPAVAPGNLTITAKTSSVKASATFAVAATPAPQPPVVSTDPFRFGVATPAGRWPPQNWTTFLGSPVRAPR